jgi:hypothetical protein
VGLGESMAVTARRACFLPVHRSRFPSGWRRMGLLLQLLRSRPGRGNGQHQVSKVCVVNNHNSKREQGGVELIFN